MATTFSKPLISGKVPECKRVGTAVWFRAEIGEFPIIEKVARGYLTHVSVQVDSDEVECSKCLQPSREQGLLKHLCPGAWEIVHKPRVRELSIVASPAYQNTEFHPVGFAAAMYESQGRYTDAAKVMLQLCMKDLLQRIRKGKDTDDLVAYDSLVTRVMNVAADLLRLR